MKLNKFNPKDIRVEDQRPKNERERQIQTGWFDAARTDKAVRDAMSNQVNQGRLPKGGHTPSRPMRKP